MYSIIMSCQILSTYISDHEIIHYLKEILYKIVEVVNAFVIFGGADFNLSSLQFSFSIVH